MNLTPNKFIQSSVALLPIATGVTLFFEDSWFAAGVILSGMFLVLNLYLWIRIVGFLIGRVAQNPQNTSTSGLYFFVFMKLLDYFAECYGVIMILTRHHIKRNCVNI